MLSEPLSPGCDAGLFAQELGLTLPLRGMTIVFLLFVFCFWRVGGFHRMNLVFWAPF